MRLQTLCMVIISFFLVSCQTVRIPEPTVSDAFAGRTGSFVLINCSSGEMSAFFPNESTEPLPPCSSFKIWNTLVGLETGIVHSPDEMFYQWDGKVREIPEWNSDLTLKEAFQSSCVPAFQSLARKIGTQIGFVQYDHGRSAACGH